MLVGGLVATVAFDLFGQWLTPTLGFARLAPVPLATQTLQVLLGLTESAVLGGTIVHWATGILFYPIGYVFIALPIARAIIPGIHWLVVAVVYGVVLWVFALYVMAHLVAGNPPFLGFTGITYVALVGHVVYAVVLGAVLAARR
ncbi:hypothetical protein JCR33_04730 [Acuticoccus sp. 2012]|uniref:Uncharacterized protein n=2 Tax=Acuticoccus mangrovi TaxID=2796142 RepID=A0A934ILS6_9HYPH|nr:hypothetical protein [Acuticoccus mangrovi]